MRLLDRYLLRELVIPFGYCLGGFLIFWISFDLFQELAELQKAQLHLLDYVEYYLWKLPELLNTVLPVALLLACLYALTHHARHHELTAIRSAGVSLWRLSLPYLLVGLVCSLWLFAVNEVWGPRSADAAERIRRRNLSSSTTAAARTLKNFGFPSKLGRVWQMDSYDLLTGDMEAVHVGWTQPGGARRELVAKRGEWKEGVWVFYDAIDTVFSNTPSAFPWRTVTNRLEVPELSETPPQIRSAVKINTLFSKLKQASKRPQLSIREILDYQALYPEEMRRSTPLLTQFHGRLAAPWTCLVVVLVAIPFGAPSGRRNAFVGVAASVFLCLAYFFLMRWGMALGTAGKLPPWLAAWGPNLLFSLMGIGLTSRVR